MFSFLQLCQKQKYYGPIYTFPVATWYDTRVVYGRSSNNDWSPMTPEAILAALGRSPTPVIKVRDAIETLLEYEVITEDAASLWIEGSREENAHGTMTEDGQLVAEAEGSRQADYFWGAVFFLTVVMTVQKLK